MKTITSIAIAACLLAGCGGSSNENPISGTVSIDGTPVSAGTLLLTPDALNGNKGPSVTLQIKDGKFQSGSSDVVTYGANLASVSPVGGGSQEADAGQEGGQGQGQGQGGRDRPYRKNVDIPKGGGADLAIEFSSSD